MRRTQHTGNPTILFKISDYFKLTILADLKQGFVKMLQQWQAWLTAESPNIHEKQQFLPILVSKFVSLCHSDCSPGEINSI